jgi:hypothetical protein
VRLNIGVWTAGTERAGRDGEVHIVRGVSGDSGPVGNEHTLGGDQARGRRGRSMRVAAIEHSARGCGRRVTSARAAGSERKSSGKRMQGQREVSTRTARAGGIKREGGGNARETQALSARVAGI